MSRNVNPDPHPSLRDAVDVTRFWSLVDRRRTFDCWQWWGYLDDDGYGVFSWHGTRVGAHVLSLSFSTGEILGKGMETRHSCDNPPCVNPEHLRFGSHVENVRDMHERGRAARSGKLLDAQIIEMRERRERGARQLDLARDYGVSDGQVSMIVRGLRWPEVGGPIQTERKYQHGK